MEKKGINPLGLAQAEVREEQDVVGMSITFNRQSGEVEIMELSNYESPDAVDLLGISSAFNSIIGDLIVNLQSGVT